MPETYTTRGTVIRLLNFNQYVVVIGTMPKPVRAGESAYRFID